MTSGSPKTKPLALGAAVMFSLGALQLAKHHTMLAAAAFVVGILLALQAAYFWRKYRR